MQILSAVSGRKYQTSGRFRNRPGDPRGNLETVASFINDKPSKIVPPAEARVLSEGMTGSVDSAQGRDKSREAHHSPARKLKVISWNLLYGKGARVEDVAALIARHKPDLLLMQEVTESISVLPTLAGGYFFREPMHKRIYGLATWAPVPFSQPAALPLPVTTIPGGVPPRLAQILQMDDITFANVHLSHGQFLNRWQLLHIARAIEGPSVIIGDFNAVGPIKMAGFRDVGPRQFTHKQRNVLSFRLDRCLVRNVNCLSARVLERGPSDHHPIILDLHVVADNAHLAKPRNRHVERLSGLVLSRLGRKRRPKAMHGTP
jgi:endonuclease/exonuclease/phosphatase (EEP) superfamily protein YafD